MGVSAHAAAPQTLDEAIALAERANPDVLDALDALAKARIGLNEAGGKTHVVVALAHTDNYGEITLNGTGGAAHSLDANEKLTIGGPLGRGNWSAALYWDPTVTFSSDPAVPNSYDTHLNYSLNVSQPILPARPSATQLALKSAERAVADAEGRLAAERDTVAIQVESAYRTAVQRRSDVAAANFKLQEAKQALARAQAQFSAGQATEADVADARLDLQRAAGRLDDAQFAFTQGIGDLNDLLGLPRDTATSLPDVAAPEFDVTLLAAQSEATANRRELATAERAQSDAAQNLVEAKQDAGVQVDGFAGFSNGTNKPLSHGAWSIGVDVDVPILYGAARGGDIERAKIDQAAAQRNYDEVKRSVAADVDQRYHDWTSAKRDVDFAQAAA
ncbi:MAG TPA: TolC family protein, partial [Limnochordia bacterium]|nr:TolC family protein [Limnochordia bacterium]